MREQLLGYVLGALDEDEHAQVEEALRRDPQLQREVELLHDSLDPLRAGEGAYEPPVGLAARTCQTVETHRPTPASVIHTESIASRGSWTLVDAMVAAGIFIAASLLFFPAISHSRSMARRAGCENNLRGLGAALTKYSENNDGQFPLVPAQGNLSTAGMYAPTLVSQNYVTDQRTFLCPSSSQAAEASQFVVPSVEEILKADPTRLVALRKTMGGSYGYTLGYISGGNYVARQNLRRATVALMADAPSLDDLGSISDNHGRCGQNVLYEDGRVTYLHSCTAKGCNDNIFLNNDGQVAPGTDQNDAVIVHSSLGPSQAR